VDAGVVRLVQGIAPDALAVLEHAHAFADEHGRVLVEELVVLRAPLARQVEDLAERHAQQALTVVVHLADELPHARDEPPPEGRQASVLELLGVLRAVRAVRNRPVLARPRMIVEPRLVRLGLVLWFVIRTRILFLEVAGHAAGDRVIRLGILRRARILVLLVSRTGHRAVRLVLVIGRARLGSECEQRQQRHEHRKPGTTSP
jgi:hypothetical protein